MDTNPSRLDRLIKTLTSDEFDYLMEHYALACRTSPPDLMQSTAYLNPAWDMIELPNAKNDGLALTAYVSLKGHICVTNQNDFGSDLIMLDYDQAHAMIQAWFDRHVESWKAVNNG